LKLAILDCLAKSPEHRPQTARDLLRKLVEAERELAPDQVWTEDRARGWWQKHQPPVRASLPGSGSAPEQLRIADVPQQS
jgi:hypothetical protein